MDGYRGERRGSHSAADPAAFFIGYRPGVPDSAAWAQVVTLTRRRRPWSSSARRSTGGARNYIPVGASTVRAQIGRTAAGGRASDR